MIIILILYTSNYQFFRPLFEQFLGDQSIKKRTITSSTTFPMVRVVKLFQTFTHKLEIFIVLYQFLIIFYQRIEKVAIIFMLLLYNTIFHHNNISFQLILVR